MKSFYENWRANWLDKYSSISIKGPLKVKGHKFIVILVSFLSGRARLDRESDLTVNQERDKGVILMKDHDI